MTDSNVEIERSIRTYLEGHGGSVQDAGGRGLTDELAKEIGVDNPMLVSATLARMEGDGVVTREMRGLRTYRIGLGSADVPGQAPPTPGPPAPPGSVPPAVTNGAASSEAPPAPPAVTNGAASSEAPPTPGAGSMSLREALSRQSSAAAVVVEPTVEPAAAPFAAEPAAESAPSQAVPVPPAAAIADNPEGADSVEGPPGAEPSPAEPVKAMSLREALAGRSASGDSASAVGLATPVASESAAPPMASTGAAGSAPSLSRAASAAGAVGTQTEVLPAVAPDAPPPDAGRAISLREALARGGDILPAPAGAPGRNGTTTSLRDAPPAPEATAAGAVSQGRNLGRGDDLPEKDRPKKERSKKERPTKGGRSRLRPRLSGLSMPVPEMSAPPSRNVLTIVGAALGVLVLIAVISVVLIRPAKHVPALGTSESSVDACQVVTPDQATAAFGHNAGPAHLVLGTCVYDDGTHEFIVEIARSNAKSVFNASRTPAAQNVPGIGDAAYYADGRLWVLKQSALMQLILGPVPASAPAPELLALAHSAVGHL
ncbi:MAG: hypothetical protein QOE57_2634 [Acidimicrobiaceae bacterium]|nr:hypothetical protein [Acidimicrobiaceae bacterium]